MVSSGSGLPRFGKPPVVETVLGVFFRPIEKLNSAYLGVMWQKYFREEFPRVEEFPPIEEVPERFGVEVWVDQGAALRWEIRDRPATPRVWAASEAGEAVIQLQKNAFFANWVKKGHETLYPPYVQRREKFFAQLSLVDQFIHTERLGEDAQKSSVEPTSCVVTYINHIDLSDQPLGESLEKVLTCWSRQTSDGWLPEAEQVGMNLSFPMPEQVGRLHVVVRPIVRRLDQKKMLRLELTARSAKKTRSLPEAFEWLDWGHEWVVRGFASITRDQMHQIWERIR